MDFSFSPVKPTIRLGVFFNFHWRCHVHQWTCLYVSCTYFCQIRPDVSERICKKYVQIRTRYVHIYTYRIRSCTYMILTCQYRILTCQYHIRTVSIGPYLHVSERILVNAFLLLPPCSPALACAPARGRCTFAWAQARGRCTFKFDVLSLRQVRRAGSADAGE